jgi:hypothetical protein
VYLTAAAPAVLQVGSGPAHASAIEDKDDMSAPIALTFAVLRFCSRLVTTRGKVTIEGNVMSDSAEFKALVRRRMDATGEKYTEAYRALLRAAEAGVLPMSGRRILPRIAAMSEDRPADVYVQLPAVLTLELDGDELARYLEASADVREELVNNWLIDQVGQLIEDGEIILDHGVIHENQILDDHARREAAYLGISPDQYVWLSDRLTAREFEELSDDAMHQLLADEYREYPAPAEQ